MDLISATSIETLTKLLLPIILSMLFIVFWWRAGSVHSIMERLWRITAGKTPIKNRELAEFIETNREIEKFRFIYRLKIERHEDLQRFIRWHKSSGVPLQDIQSLRHWFDVSEDDFIKQPIKGLLALTGLFTAILFVFAVGLISVGASDKAYLRMKSSGTAFKSDGTSIESWFGKWKADNSSCDKEIKTLRRNFGFNESEAKMICESFQDGSLSTTVEGAIKSQRKVGITLGLFCGPLFLYFFRELITTFNAIQFPKRLEQVRIKNSRTARH